MTSCHDLFLFNQVINNTFYLWSAFQDTHTKTWAWLWRALNGSVVVQGASGGSGGQFWFEKHSPYIFFSQNFLESTWRTCFTRAQKCFPLLLVAKWTKQQVEGTWTSAEILPLRMTFTSRTCIYGKYNFNFTGGTFWYSSFFSYFSWTHSYRAWLSIDAIYERTVSTQNRWRMSIVTCWGRLCQHLHILRYPPGFFLLWIHFLSASLFSFSFSHRITARSCLSRSQR